jgi:hypothetical protein
MSYTKSPKDVLSQLSAELKRNLSDIRIDVLGTKTKVLRIEVGEKDLFGDYDETLLSDLTANVIINHPMGNNQWLFSTLNSDNEMEVDTINLWEILPIKMKVKYSSELELSEEPVAIKKGDIIVELLEDENSNKIQVVYQVSKLFGGFEGKYLYEKSYELNLYRGTIPSDIQNSINNYVNN